MPRLFMPPRLVLILVLGLAAPLILHAADSKPSEGETKAHASDCFSCHAVDHKLVGPAYQDVAERYAGKGDAEVKALVQKIRKGGSGHWGDIPMTPHPQLSDADLTAMVTWILSMKPAAALAKATATATASTEKHSYKEADGKSVTTDFAVFNGSDQKTVSDSVFLGYEQYNSYCFRCHGGDAVGGEYAPDLRKSLENNMTFDQFLGVAMAGRADKGMPSWAGFFEEKEIRAIYDYIKARQLGLVPVGRPPSAQD